VNQTKLKSQILQGLLAFGGDNLCYARTDGLHISMEKATAIMVNRLYKALIEVHAQYNESEEMLELMCSAAIGLLSSPHDNLNRASEMAQGSGTKDECYYLALACYTVAREIKA
jgi:hypothetical protein